MILAARVYKKCCPQAETHGMSGSLPAPRVGVRITFIAAVKPYWNLQRLDRDNLAQGVLSGRSEMDAFIVYAVGLVSFHAAYHCQRKLMVMCGWKPQITQQITQS